MRLGFAEFVSITTTAIFLYSLFLRPLSITCAASGVVVRHGSFFKVEIDQLLEVMSLSRPMNAFSACGIINCKNYVCRLTLFQFTKKIVKVVKLWKFDYHH